MGIMRECPSLFATTRSTLSLGASLLRPRLTPATVPLLHQGYHANMCWRYDYWILPRLLPRGCSMTLADLKELREGHYGERGYSTIGRTTS